MNKKQFQEQMEKTAQLTQKEWKFQRDLMNISKDTIDILQVSLTDEQLNKQLWEGIEITFYNEDNAINHLDS